MGGSFYIAVLYENEGVALDEGSFSKAPYLELKILSGLGRTGLPAGRDR